LNHNCWSAPARDSPRYDQSNEAVSPSGTDPLFSDQSLRRCLNMASPLESTHFVVSAQYDLTRRIDHSAMNTWLSLFSSKNLKSICDLQLSSRKTMRVSHLLPIWTFMFSSIYAFQNIGESPTPAKEPQNLPELPSRILKRKGACSTGAGCGGTVRCDYD